jgi:hypothetical protein
MNQTEMEGEAFAKTINGLEGKLNGHASGGHNVTITIQNLSIVRTARRLEAKYVTLWPAPII